jgi:hypothetical protein
MKLTYRILVLALALVFVSATVCGQYGSQTYANAYKDVFKKHGIPLETETDASKIDCTTKICSIHRAALWLAHYTETHKSKIGGEMFGACSDGEIFIYFKPYEIVGNDLSRLEELLWFLTNFKDYSFKVEEVNFAHHSTSKWYTIGKFCVDIDPEEDNKFQFNLDPTKNPVFEASSGRETRDSDFIEAIIRYQELRDAWFLQLTKSEAEALGFTSGTSKAMEADYKQEMANALCEKARSLEKKTSLEEEDIGDRKWDLENTIVKHSARLFCQQMSELRNTWTEAELNVILQKIRVLEEEALKEPVQKEEVKEKLEEVITKFKCTAEELAELEADTVTAPFVWGATAAALGVGGKAPTQIFLEPALWNDILLIEDEIKIARQAEQFLRTAGRGTRIHYVMKFAGHPEALEFYDEAGRLIGRGMTAAKQAKWQADAARALGGLKPIEKLKVGETLQIRVAVEGAKRAVYEPVAVHLAATRTKLSQIINQLTKSLGADHQIVKDLTALRTKIKTAIKSVRGGEALMGALKLKAPRKMLVETWHKLEKMYPASRLKVAGGKALKFAGKALLFVAIGSEIEQFFKNRVIQYTYMDKSLMKAPEIGQATYSEDLDFSYRENAVGLTITTPKGVKFNNKTAEVGEEGKTVFVLHPNAESNVRRYSTVAEDVRAAAPWDKLTGFFSIFSDVTGYFSDVRGLLGNEGDFYIEKIEYNVLRETGKNDFGESVYSKVLVGECQFDGTKRMFECNLTEQLNDINPGKYVLAVYVSFDPLTYLDSKEKTNEMFSQKNCNFASFDPTEINWNSCVRFNTELVNEEEVIARLELAAKNVKCTALEVDALPAKASMLERGLSFGMLDVSASIVSDEIIEKLIDFSSTQYGAIVLGKGYPIIAEFEIGEDGVVVPLDWPGEPAELEEQLVNGYIILRIQNTPQIKSLGWNVENYGKRMIFRNVKGEVVASTEEEDAAKKAFVIEEPDGIWYVVVNNVTGSNINEMKYTWEAEFTHPETGERLGMGEGGFTVRPSNGIFVPEEIELGVWEEGDTIE